MTASRFATDRGEVSPFDDSRLVKAQQRVLLSVLSTLAEEALRASPEQRKAYAGQAESLLQRLRGDLPAFIALFPHMTPFVEAWLEGIGDRSGAPIPAWETTEQIIESLKVFRAAIRTLDPIQENGYVPPISQAARPLTAAAGGETEIDLQEHTKLENLVRAVGAGKAAEGLLQAAQFTSLRFFR